MSFQYVLAHGSLGAYDELIFLSVSIIFFVMMGVSWVISRNTPQPPSDTPIEPHSHDQDSVPNHFPLE